MQIQVNTDRNIEGGEPLTRMVESTLRAALDRFEDRLTRVEAHLGDVDGETRGSGADKRCLLEARPASMQPVVVTGVGSSVEQACEDAAHKMQSRLERTFGRVDERGTDTIRDHGD